MNVEGAANIPVETTNMEVEKGTSENAKAPVNVPKIIQDDGPPGDEDYTNEEILEPPPNILPKDKPEEAKTTGDMPERTGVKRPAPSDEGSEAKSKKQEDTEDWKKNIDTSNLSKREKSLLGNMSYEEETELRKNTSLGAVLSGLSTGSYGSDAKKNVVKVEGRPNWNRYGRWANNRRNFNGGYGGGWGGGMWDHWEEPYYEEEVVEEEVGSNKEWITEENKLLEEEFGPGVITLMDDEGQGMVYVCEICQAQMNGRKSLDVHVNGMKHLKKKNVWEKKRKLESFESAITDDKDAKEKESGKLEGPAKVDPSGDKGKDHTGQGQVGNKNTYLQPGMGMPLTIPPYGFPPMGGQRLPMANIPPGQWGDFSTPPPPPPVIPKAPAAPTVAPVVTPAVEEKPKVKSNLSGGATGTLLQKLAACAVKNFKDSDLATNVVISLVKAMKEFNHTKGDTRSIEVLTEIDVKLRGLKAQMAALTPDSDKKSSSSKSISKSKTDNKENSNKTTAAAPVDPLKNTAYYATAPDGVANKTAAPTDPSKIAAYYATAGIAPDGVGTWYSQGKGANIETPQHHHPTGARKATPTSSSYSVPDAGKSGGSSYARSSGSYETGYSAYSTTQNTLPAKDVSGYSSKPADSYYSQPSYSTQTGQGQYSSQSGQAPKAVYDIINSTAVPPPPPPDAANLAAYSNYAPTGYQGAYSGYYNAAPDHSQASYSY